jgi:2-polyprenyl-3-methyl-5-hydroxy-6-metoxy-1,4-benzoquinol methylase
VGEKILGLMPAGTHEWDKYMSSEEIETILSKN